MTTPPPAPTRLVPSGQWQPATSSKLGDDALKVQHRIVEQVHGVSSHLVLLHVGEQGIPQNRQNTFVLPSTNDTFCYAKYSEYILVTSLKPRWIDMLGCYWLGLGLAGAWSDKVSTMVA
jgi:hypothetical protein